MSPDIQTPAEFQFYVEQNGLKATQREFERNSLPGLQKSLSKAHDNLQKQVGINTRLYVQLTKAERRLDRYTIMLWILGIFLTGEGAIVIMLTNFVLGRLK
jgi:hypothetical protein